MSLPEALEAFGAFMLTAIVVWSALIAIVLLWARYAFPDKRRSARRRGQP
jgi:multisubunit Na+/H+ antiporter MnhC subunit